VKPSTAQSRIVGRMARGARLGWNACTGAFELVDGVYVRTIQARTVNALDVAGLIQRDALGDCALSLRGRQHAAASGTSSDIG
jgi:hypothetical protein